MGASQGKKKAATAPTDPVSSAKLAEQLAKKNKRGGQVMPWNEDNDNSLNDRAAVGQPAPQNNKATPASKPSLPLDDSFEELSRQIEQIQRQSGQTSPQ